MNFTMKNYRRWTGFGMSQLISKKLLILKFTIQNEPYKPRISVREIFGYVFPFVIERFQFDDNFWAIGISYEQMIW